MHFISYPRKCLITWKRKETRAFSRAYRDWWSLAGIILYILCTILSVQWKSMYVLISSASIWLLRFLSPVCWTWMHLRGRTKQKDSAWCQRKVQVSWDVLSDPLVLIVKRNVILMLNNVFHFPQNIYFYNQTLEMMKALANDTVIQNVLWCLIFYLLT